MIYRIKQFYWDLSSSFKKIDYDFLNKYLNKDEIELFDKLSKSEKHHCVRVARNAFQYINMNKILDIDIMRIMKICLLHDIGKIGVSLNVIDRSILVLLNKFTRGNLKKYDNMKKIDVFYNHPQKAMSYLRDFKYDDDFLFIIRNHHNKDVNNNKTLDILKKCDAIS
ncbi:HD domain-containing protein [Desnuesiella massiliensis]|uniref:HD domain-containing protein n=1 Tax=Desnuesiella massiliensis TaxID=1650662 RepID=UPI0006E46AD6|nr:HD domain-containing protein [Desnuesiella massiliensis]